VSDRLLGRVREVAITGVANWRIVDMYAQIGQIVSDFNAAGNIQMAIRCELEFVERC
jgi:hypothetical protein